ncbi:MAG: hypothetical protein J2P55_09850 [Rhizobiales bacterium]|nr:hypothetical protein [Hyphomicrobiales bacterium]
MPQQTQLYIVASRHPRVGKTLLTRLLIEFLRISGRPMVGYDLDPREPALAGYFPSLVWPVDIADTRGQMALFDRILADHWRTTVIDLGQGLFDQFFKVMTEIGFDDEARQKLIQPIVLFIADAAPFTAQTYTELRGRLKQTIFVPVHNEAASFMMIAQDFPPSSPKYETLRIPRLSPIVRGVIDRPGFSFSAYMSQQPGGPTEVHSWIGQIFAEFRELELQLLIGELESSLRGRGKGRIRQTG